MEKISPDSRIFATSDSMVEAKKNVVTIKAKDDEKGKTFATFGSANKKVVTQSKRRRKRENVCHL